MTKEQFYIRLFLGLISGIILVFSFLRMANRNSCESRESLQHKGLKILGWFLLGCALLDMLVFFGIISSITFPNQVIEPAISKHTIVRPHDQYVIWGQATQSQFMAISCFLGCFLNLALSLYCLMFKKSNTSGLRKFGKVVFCILFVMFYFSATEFHYFDIYEYVATICFAIMAFYALRKKSNTSVIPKTEQPSMSINNQELKIYEAIQNQDIVKEEDPFVEENKKTPVAQQEPCSKGCSFIKSFRFWYIMGFSLLLLAIVVYGFCYSYFDNHDPKSYIQEECSQYNPYYLEHFDSLQYNYFVVDPARDKYNQDFYNCILIIITCLILSLCCFVASLVRLRKTHKATPNKKATNLLTYINCMAILDVILIILFLTDGYHVSWDDDCYSFWDEVFYTILYLVIPGCVLKMILVTYLNKKVQCEDNYFYLIPKKYQNRLRQKFNSPVGFKMYAGFVFYPLYYACTIPLGVYILIYEGFAALCFEIYFAFKWMFDKNDVTLNYTSEKIVLPPNNNEGSIEQRLSQLKSLFEKGLISQSDYEEKKRDILNDF